ncbi:Aminoacyl-tRNA synthetase, class II [Phytophthora cactorum]|nr:Aminoacyl-tRNA synthetase, class II [Phytophthora cactorum]
MLGLTLRRGGPTQASEMRRWLSTAAKAKAISRVRGTRDLLADDSQQHREVLDVLQRTVERYGFRSFLQIQTPLLEYTDLFSRSLGDGSDIVMKEMYTFKDNSGKSVTLRPEGTAGIMRALVSSSLMFSLPQKVSYAGSMFRYERPQRGRYREFQQFAGGCYDGLTESLGGPATACVGWAAGVDRLNLLREKQTEVVFSVAVVPVLAGDNSNQVLHEAMRVAQTLRQRGLTVHFCHGSGNMKKQMKAAERYGSTHAVILGGAEVEQQFVKVKNLDKREETEVSMEELGSFEFH